jgi:hypothetical protein
MPSKLTEVDLIMSSPVLIELGFARRIADYADTLGVQHSPVPTRLASDHLGAVLADAILQAGVSYRTILEDQGTAEFLLWNHPIKQSRFVSIIKFFDMQQIGTTNELKLWLNRSDARDHLLSLHGIGPKTYDYLCCLVGIDCIAVDRHVRTFANEAGVAITDYDQLKSVVSYAADLLGMSRRDFDAWIWRTVSARNMFDRQLSLNLPA